MFGPAQSAPQLLRRLLSDAAPLGRWVFDVGRWMLSPPQASLLRTVRAKSRSAPVPTTSNQPPAARLSSPTVEIASPRLFASFDAVNPLPSSLVAVLAVTLYAHAEAPAEKKAAPSPSAPASVKAAAEPKNVTPDEAEKLINSRKDLVVLDVRTEDEFKAGHIKGAINASFLDDDFEQKLKAVEGKPVLVHCQSGGRSAKAVKQMLGKDFPELYHMNGGMKAWLDANKEVVKPN